MSDNKSEKPRLLSDAAFKFRGTCAGNRRKESILCWDLLHETFAGRTDVGEDELKAYCERMEAVVPAHVGETPQFTKEAATTLDRMGPLATPVANSFPITEWDVDADSVIRRAVEVLMLVSVMGGVVRELDGDGSIATCSVPHCGERFIPTLVRVFREGKELRPAGHYFAYKGQVYGPVCHLCAEEDRDQTGRRYYSKAAAEEGARLQTERHNQNVFNSQERQKYFPQTRRGERGDGRRGNRF